MDDRGFVTPEEIRALIASQKEHERNVMAAWQEGAGHPDAPLSLDLALASTGRNMDLMAESIGCLDRCAKFRIEINPPDVGNFAKDLEDAIEYDTVDCAGARSPNGTTILYLVTPPSNDEEEPHYGPNVLQWLLKHPAVVSVRDWAWY